MLDECGVPIDGSCAPEFERVRDTFKSTLTDRADIGAAVAIWVEGAGEAPGHPESLTEHPMAGLAVAMGFVPDDELGSNALELWRTLEFPATNGHVSAPLRGFDSRRPLHR